MTPCFLRVTLARSGGRKAKKGFRPTAVCRVAIEVPVRDQSAAAMAELMRDLLRDMEEPLGETLVWLARPRCADAPGLWVDPVRRDARAVVYCGDDFEQFRTALGKDSVRSFDTLDAPGSRLLFIVGARCAVPCASPARLRAAAPHVAFYGRS